MTDLAAGEESQAAKTMAAVMAAVQAYLDEEARAISFQGPTALNAWKTEPWPTTRGERPRRSRSWRRGN